MKQTVWLKPNSRKGPLVEPQADGSLVVYVRQPAVENKANQALIEQLAKYFDKPKTAVKIVRGQTSRHKIIEID